MFMLSSGILPPDFYLGIMIIIGLMLDSWHWPHDGMF